MPVDVVFGSQFTAAHDIAIGGHLPLLFRREYNTDWLTRPISGLGRGWSHVYNARLLRDLDGYRFVGYDGAEVAFDGDDQELSAGGAIRNLPSFMELRREGNHLVVWHWHGWRGPVRRFLFDASAGDEMRATAIENVAGQGLNLNYDERGRLVRIEQSIERRALVFRYDSAGLLAHLGLAWAAEPDQDPLTIAIYSHDGRQRLTEVRDARGAATFYEYDERDQLVAERGPSGSVALMQYDSEGRCVAMGGADGYMKRAFQYDKVGRRTLVTDSLNRTTTYQYNEKGQIILVTQPNGAETATQFDDFGRIVSVSGPLCEDGPSIVRKYDARGDLIEVEFANKSKRTLEYDETHQVTAIHDITDAVWQIRYERGAVVEITNPAGESMHYRRDSRNVLTEIVTPWDNRIRIEHDEFWRYERHTDLVGLLFEHDYNILLLPVRVADSGGTAEFEYDALGGLLRYRSPDGAQSRYSYTPAGMLAEYVNANGGRIQLSWSPWNQCVQVTDANHLSHDYEWDTEGRVISIRNPRGECAELAYDSVGYNTSQHFFDGSTEHYEYDVFGRLIARIRPDGARIEIAVDQMGNELEVKLDGVPTLTFAYDAAGRELKAASPNGLVEFTYDECGRIAAETQCGRTVRYVYGKHGNVTKRDFDGGQGGPLYFDYDVRARLTAIRDDRGRLQEFRYDVRDLAVERMLSGARERLEYDDGGRLTRQEISGGWLKDTIVRTYRYDPDGNLTTTQDSRYGTIAFTYDAGERMSASENQGARTEYTYDADGNITVRGGLSLRYGVGDRLLGIGSAKLERDANGNLLNKDADGRRQCYQWDALGQLVGVQHHGGAVTRYGYDAFGRRIFKDHNGERTEFFWSGNDLLAERTGESVTEYAIDRFWPHLIRRNGEVRHAIASPLSLVHELIDTDGKLVWSGWYDPWGTLVRSDGSVPEPRLRYPGQYFDSETGFHYNRARYYDPCSGSFLSPDPTGLKGGPNLYLYAPNPVTYADPLGLQCGVTTSGYSVYVLTNGNPPQVVYVGITDQLPHQRLSGHRGDKAPGSFDNMQVIATGLKSRRSARNLEGSLLNRIFAAQQPPSTPYHVAGMPVAPSLLNKRRKATPGYKDGYVRGSPSIGQDGRRILTPSQITNSTSVVGAPIPR